MKSYQLTHEEFKSKQIKNSNDIIFILDNFEHYENIGSAFRLADAFNITKIIIVSATELNFAKIKKTARNTEKNVTFEIVQKIDEALKIVGNLGYTPCCVEICSDSKPLREIDFSKYSGVAIILGNENFGISEKTLSLVDDKVHIDMYGNNSSMNVATALAIATYKISEDRLRR